MTGRTTATRRDVLLGGAAAATASAAAFAAGRATAVPEPHGSAVERFFGEHQPGIVTEPQAHATFLSFTLKPQVGREQLASLMGIWTDDARRLMAGQGALADMEPELAEHPARLTVTFGFGPQVFEAAALEDRKPAWLRPLPAFEQIDRLEDRHSGGDLLVQVCGDDPLALAHAVRVFTKDARAFAELKWSQKGFRNAAGALPKGRTMRNLMGQLDGTANPGPADPMFDRLLWSPAEGKTAWLAGGTSWVLRRIRMDLDTWDELDRNAREIVVGRRLDTGAPLTGTAEHDEPDLDARSPNGLKVIPDYAHVRRARTGDPERRIVRRAYNYDDTGAGVDDAGLLFCSFQADVDRQFVPLQRRLAELDLLNTWTTPVGSAVFAIPGGCREGEYVGQALLG